MKYIYIILGCMFCMACNDWLDVRPDTEQKDKDQFSSVKGFYNALVGCYMTMAGQDIYGERLSMTNIESLANQWYMTEDNTRYEDKDLTLHDYSTDYSKDAIKSIYAGLFKVIAEANMIIKYASENESVFVDDKDRAVVQGEAYAIRAYCQLDVLRLFGQLPKDAVIQVELPYSEATSIDEIPPYYGFDDYVEKLESDLEKAEQLLKNNDPIFEYTFKELDETETVGNTYFKYRRTRLNYWAVKALQARMLLYLGKKDDAYRIACEVIRATGPDGNAVMKMSGTEDFKAGYKLCPSECLFCLSKYNVMTYSVNTLIGGDPDRNYRNENLAISSSMLTKLYEGMNTSAHNRFLNCWNKNLKDDFGNSFAATTKYYFDENAQGKMLYYQLIPMLRMSEVYLIAMEGSDNLSEINEWYRSYMLAHDVVISEEFTSLEDSREFIFNEYRREFFAEGQMFYTYKRYGVNEMLWRTEEVTEEEYILPLPNTEYNPATNK